MARCLLPGFYLIIFLAGCGSTVQQLPIAELDYTEIENATGWSLRVYGNGSGSIRHEQLPAYHLHYPQGTFLTSHLRPRLNSCGERTGLQNCTRVAQYSSLHDTTFHCNCIVGAWTEELMVVAIDQMETAVDAGESIRSCRMLRRRWLAAY